MLLQTPPSLKWFDGLHVRNHSVSVLSIHCQWSRFLRGSCVSMGSNKSLWWLCPSLGILCSYWGSVWPGAGSEMWHMLLGIRVWFQIVSFWPEQGCGVLSFSNPFPAVTQGEDEPKHELSPQNSSHMFMVRTCACMKEWTEGISTSASQHKISVLYTCAVIWVWLIWRPHVSLACRCNALW